MIHWSCRLAIVLLAVGTAAAAPATTRATAGRDWDPIPAKNPAPDRYRAYHELVAKGDHCTVERATFLGTKDHEALLGGGEFPDGAIVAFGNAWGPEYPGAPVTKVLGKGTHQGLPPTVAEKNSQRPAWESPDCAAFIAFYSPGLKLLDRLVRFAPGMGSLSAGLVLPDGKGLIIAGRATPDLKELKPLAGKYQATPIGGGAYTYAGAKCSGDVYVMCLSPDATKIEWIWVFEAAGTPPDRLYPGPKGSVYADIKGLRRISQGGTDHKLVATHTQTGVARWHMVDPADGSAWFGGDRNTHTNKEPWRQPYLYKFGPDGQKTLTLWQESPKEVGSDHGGLESDSAVRGVAIRSDKTLLVSGWSDGGNSVFQRQPTDWKRNCPDSALGWGPWWPKGANSYAHVMVVDPVAVKTNVHLWWCGYLPMNFSSGPGYANRTAGQSIRWIIGLADDSVAFTGGGTSGLIQTPNAFWKDPGKGDKYSGDTCVVLDKNLGRVLFSSYLPGLKEPKPVATRDGLLVFSRSVGTDGNAQPTPSPAVNPLQPHAGGSDGHILLLKLPKPQPAAK